METKSIFFAFALSLAVLTSCNKNESILGNQEAPVAAKSNVSTLKSGSLNGKYIVVLKKDAQIASLDVNGKKEHVKAKANGLLKKYEISGEVENVYESALQGFAVRLAPGQVAKLEADGEVKSIEADGEVTINGKRSTKPAPAPAPAPAPTPSQNTPWGITRVNGGITFTGTNVVWVIDTGIDLTHPDLKVDAARGISFVVGVTSPNDDNGHGTHIAGTIAAINNGYGVIGVAAGATVIPVKVLGSTGCGSFADVLSGINYVAANAKLGDVVNLSIDGGASPTIDNAIVTASAVVKFAIAAGNQAANAINYSPARAEGVNIYTVSAMASGDTWASFSNYGTPVDYCAPGVSIYSTYKGGGYASMSGTSMAAPHVAGLLLLGNITTNGHVGNDPDGSADPIASR